MNQFMQAVSPTATDGYATYRDWKGWSTLFQATRAECLLYASELGEHVHCGGRLLDVGFGSGSLLAWARSLGATVAGIEIQDTLVAEARSQGIATFEDVAAAPDLEFDCITLFDVMEHLTEAVAATTLKEAMRSLKPGGVVVTRVPNCQSPAGLAYQFADATHCTMWSGPRLKVLFEQAGYVDVRYREAQDLRKNRKFAFFDGLIRLKTAFVRRAYRTVWALHGIPVSANVLVIGVKPLAV